MALYFWLVSGLRLYKLIWISSSERVGIRLAGIKRTTVRAKAGFKVPPKVSALLYVILILIDASGNPKVAALTWNTSWRS